MFMLVNTDELFSKKFFSSLESSPEIHKAFQDERSELTELIKTELYSTFKKAVYYLGKHLDRKALDDFINSEDYKLLQGQLEVVIDKLKQWGETYELEERSSLDDFLVKLQNPTEKMTLLYADGKRSLEIITVLLKDDQIPLALRKVAYIQLLADNELSKCIDGCYTRIVTSMQQLELYRQSPNQINRWVRAYTTQIAKDVAAKRPFAMPESYQVLVCRTLDISIVSNELHASNYLLLKAKENEFPVDNINDIGALEIKQKMYHVNKDKLAEFYLDDLAEAVTATGLVHYIATRLHEEFDQIISDLTKDYSEKINTIEAKLKLLGSDSGFLIGEILEDDPLRLKEVEHLKLTTERRLTQQDWFGKVQPKELNISNKIYTYYNFPGNKGLNWFSVAGDTTRYRLIDLISNSAVEFGSSLKFQLLMSLFREPNYFNDIKDLTTLPEKSFLPFSLIRLISTQHIITLLKKETNSLLFVDLINKIGNERGAQILQELGKEYISNVVTEGYLKSNVKRNFFWLKDSYFIQNYNEIAIKEGIQITQQLLLQIIGKNYRDFSNFIFHRLEYLDYLKDIDFSRCELKRALFLQKVTACTFDEANLIRVHFDNRVIDSSFRGVDLRETYFFPPIINQNERLNLNAAILSTETFKQLVSSGINDFSGADLRRVDFHIVLPNKNSYLDFSGANLKNAFLSGIDFKYVNLRGGNLEDTNLMDSYFNQDYLDNKISIRGATLNKYAAHVFFSAGVQQFDNCKIVEQKITYHEKNLQFNSASFRETSFIGYTYDLEFKDCDFKGAFFISTDEFPIEERAVILNVKFKNCQLEKTAFHKINFLEPIKLQGSPLRDIVLADIEMPASVLFKFYANGQRDFSGVKALKEKIPDKLPPFPLLGASLSREVFIQLYRQGLRDFRSSNLLGFYLAKVLEEEAKSGIELRLEGAHYQQLSLSCNSSPRSSSPRSSSPHNKRSVSTCNVYFLIQRSHSKKTISWRDLQNLEIITPDKNTLLKEIVLGVTPLYVLDGATNLYFYWGYKPDNEALTQMSDFLEKSTQVTQRSFLKVNLYFDHLKTDDLQLLSQNIRNLGFVNGQLTYLDEKNQQITWNLKQKSPTEIAKINTLSALNEKIKPPIKPALPNKDWRIQLKTSVNNLRMHAKDQGLQYDAFLVLLDVISTWIRQSDPIGIKKLTLDEQLNLKDFASELVDQEALSHGANDHQHSLTFRIAMQCIERGECHNRELVQENILNTLQTLRPNLDIGFEELGKHMKSSFESLGSYFTSKFDDLLKRFSILLYIFDASNQAKNKKTKRKSIDWYSQPQIVYFIKMIESTFSDLGFDLNLDPDYSESLLVGYLYDLWQALKKQGISSQIPLNLTLDLLENSQFIQSTLDKTYLSQDNIYLHLNQSNTTQAVSTPIQSATIPPKTNRVVNDRNERLPSERQERLRQIADDYMIHYDWKSKGFKGIKGSRRSRRSKETKEPSTSFTLAKSREIAYKTYKDNSGQSVEKKIPHKLNNLSARNSHKQLTKPAISHKSGSAQLPIVKHEKHQRFFVGNQHVTSKIYSSKCSLRDSFFVKEGIAEKKLLPPPRKIHSCSLSPYAYTEKRSISQVTARPDTLATILSLNLFTRKTSQKYKPIASSQKLARYRKASRSIDKIGDPFSYHLSLR